MTRPAAACSGERIRADALEAAVFDALADFYANPAVLRDATAAGRRQAAADRRQQGKEVRAVEAELSRTDAAMRRNMLAFENGALDSDRLADRLAELEAKTKALRTRQATLTAQSASVTFALPTAAELRRLASWLRTASTAGLAVERKAIAQACVHELVVQARDRFQPRSRSDRHSPRTATRHATRAPMGRVFAP